MIMPGHLLRRVLVSLLIIATLTMISFTRASASNLSFRDISSSKYDWARPYIEKMHLAGIVNGIDSTSFAPDSFVKRDEVIAMIIRLMGLEKEAEGKSLPTDFPKASTIPLWARKYVALAVEKGIVSGQDKEDFRAEDAAERYEVAVFAVRALGLDSEVQKKTNVDLSFTDRYDIPLEAQAYVQIAVEKGIMKGFPDNVFKPKDKLTRAQAASLLNNLARQMNKLNVVTGTVEDVNTVLLPSITIKLENGSLDTFYVNNSTSIYRQDAGGNLVKIQLKDIKTGDGIEIIPDSTGVDQAAYVEISSSSTGDITAPQGTEVTRIEAQGIDKEVRGLLRYVITSDPKIIVIDNQDTDERESYNISTNATVTKDGENASLSDLLSDDMVVVTISDSKAVKIEAQSARKDISGTIKAISFSGKNPTITIEDNNGIDKDYELDEDADIRKNNRSGDVKDLRRGDEVDITLEYDKIIDIRAKSVKKDISGTVKAITISDTPTVTIIDESGDEYTFNITPDTEILEDRKSITAYDLRTGYYLDVEVEGDDAISIDVTTQEVQSKIEGSVLYVHKDAQVIVLSVKNSDGTKTTKEIHYTDDTMFIKNNKESSINRIDEGDQVIATGQYDGGLFFADTIVDITISG